MVEQSQLPLYMFETLGLLAILAGGLLAAFSAKKPSRLDSWASAYLVLIVGLFQVIIGVGLYDIEPNSITWAIILVFVTFNLGNAGVLIGTACKSRTKSHKAIVDAGGGLIIVSMLTLLTIAYNAVLSWQLIVFYVVILVVIVSAPIGLVLSRKHKLNK